MSAGVPKGHACMMGVGLAWRPCLPHRGPSSWARSRTDWDGLGDAALARGSPRHPQGIPWQAAVWLFWGVLALALALAPGLPLFFSVGGAAGPPGRPGLGCPAAGGGGCPLAPGGGSPRPWGGVSSSPFLPRGGPGPGVWVGAWAPRGCPPCPLSLASHPGCCPSRPPAPSPPCPLCPLPPVPRAPCPLCPPCPLCLIQWT